MLHDRKLQPTQSLASDLLIRCFTAVTSAQKLIPLGSCFRWYIHIGFQQPGHRRERVYDNRDGNQPDKQVSQVERDAATPQKKEESENKKWIKFRGVTLGQAHK